MSKSRRIAKGDVVARARELWEEGWVSPTGHCKEQLRARNFALPDIEEALFSPECKCTAVEQKGRAWRYRLEGCIEEEERESIGFVFEIDQENATLRLVTVFSMGEV